MAAVIEVQGLVNRFGRQVVHDGLDLEIRAGEVFGIVGGSGSGKSVLLRTLLGLQKPSGGSVRIEGSEITHRPERELLDVKRRYGVLFQRGALFSSLTVAQNVELPIAEHYRVSEATLRALALLRIRMVGLPEDTAAKYPAQLSGGMTKRVALARALAPRPRLVLLDEPFSNLDADVRTELAQAVRAALLAEGATALLVTHDQREAFAIADEIGVLRAGRLEQWDAPWKLYHSPKTRFVADFVGEGTFIPGTVVGPGRVSTELGVIEGQLTRDQSPGALVDLLLRPDDVIHDDASELQAEVVERAFRGAQFRYTLRLPSGATALSFVPSHHDHAIGERIGIRLDAQHLVGFPRGWNQEQE